MKIEMLSLTEEAVEKRDYCNILVIKIDGKKEFSVYDGEPEDANLYRNFNDCWKITDLMKKAYQAGVNGEPFEVTDKLVDEI